MIYNHRAFLRNLPLATDLTREFLAEHVFDTQAVDWSAEEPTLAEALADAIESHPDTTVRDDLIAAIEQVAQLADGAGTRQMLTVCSTDPKITAAIETLESPEERALWLYVNSPAKFNGAVLARLFVDGLTRGSSHRCTVLTDQTMPGMTGIELARELKRIRPDLPILLYSGHGELLRVAPIDVGVLKVLSKPIDPAEMRAAMAQALDRSHAHPENRGQSPIS